MGKFELFGSNKPQETEILQTTSLFGDNGRWEIPCYDEYKYHPYTTYISGNNKKDLIDNGIRVHTLFVTDFRTPQDVEKGLDKIRAKASNGLKDQIEGKKLWIVSSPCKGLQTSVNEIQVLSIDLNKQCEHLTLRNLAECLTQARNSQEEINVRVIAWSEETN